MGSQGSKVFVSYSHKDRAWLERIQVHLRPLVRDGQLDLWDDTRISPGQPWHQEIQHALATTRVAILLISADFLASDFIATSELPPLLTAAETGGVIMMPVILSPSRFNKTALSQFQSVNPPECPLIDMARGEQEKWLVNLAEAVESALHRSLPSEASQLVERPWNVGPKNFSFTGREAILQQLRKDLSSQGRVLLSGLGGIGKTQIAIHYAHRQRSHYRAVLWVAADTAEALLSNYASLAQVLALPAQHDQQKATQAVNAWLEAHPDWLLIFDGADETDRLEPLLLDKNGQPQSFLRQGWGHLLITSRAQQAQRLGFSYSLQIPKMAAQDALQFLLSRIGRPAVSASETAAASALANELDYLPLALEQAAAYMVQIQAPVEDYLQSYRQQRLALLDAAGPLQGGRREPLATTWLMNFKAVAATSPAATGLLHWSAFLAPVAIPLELLQRGAKVLGPELASALANVANDPLAISRILEPLTRYSLIQRDVAQRSFSIHRLVQEFVQNQLPEALRKTWLERAVRAIDAAFPNDIYADWQYAAPLVPHALQMSTWLAASDKHDSDKPSLPCLSEAARLFERTGNYLFEQHNFSVATALYEKARAIARQVYGDNSAEYAGQLINLARVGIVEKKYPEARRLLDQAINIDTQALGYKHPDFAITLTEAGKLAMGMGDYASAQARLHQAQQLLLDCYGDIHVQVATGWHNLAQLEHVMGQSEEAVQHYRWALTVYKNLLDKDDPRIATSLHNLGSLYRDQGHYSNALQCYQRALAIRQEAMSGSQDYLDSLYETAAMYHKLGDDKVAAPLLQDALDLNATQHGTQHPKYLACLSLLADVYAGMGRLADAEQLYRENIKIHAQSVGQRDKRFTASLYRLAQFFFQTERYLKAEKTYTDLIDAERHFLAPEDPNFLTSLSGLAGVYQKIGQMEKAAKLYEDIVEQRRKTPDNQRNLAIDLYQLAQLYLNMQTHYDKAEKLFLEVIEIERTTLGEDHPDFAMTLNGLAWLYELTGEAQKAQDYYQRALQIQLQVFGKEHPSVRRTAGYLARLMDKL